MSRMKADVTAENRPACPPIKTNEQRDQFNAKNTYEDQRGIQVFTVFLRKVTVIVVGFMFKFVVELHAGVVGGSKEVGKEGWQCLAHGILQAGEER